MKRMMLVIGALTLASAVGACSTPVDAQAPVPGQSVVIASGERDFGGNESQEWGPYDVSMYTELSLLQSDCLASGGGVTLRQILPNGRTVDLVPDSQWNLQLYESPATSVVLSIYTTFAPASCRWQLIGQAAG